jgi:hypothetical protein
MVVERKDLEMTTCQAFLLSIPDSVESLESLFISSFFQGHPPVGDFIYVLSHLAILLYYTCFWTNTGTMTRMFMVTISLVLLPLGSLFFVMLLYDLDVLKPSPRPSERLYSEDGEVHFVPTPSGFICRTLGRESIIGEGIKI